MVGAIAWCAIAVAFNGQVPAGQLQGQPATLSATAGDSIVVSTDSGASVSWPTGVAVEIAGFDPRTFGFSVTYQGVAGAVGIYDLVGIGDTLASRELPSIGSTVQLSTPFDSIVWVYDDETGSGPPHPWPDGKTAWITRINPGSWLVEVSDGPDSVWVHAMYAVYERCNIDVAEEMLAAGRHPPEILDCPVPRYPTRLMRERAVGVVIFQAVVDTTGRIDPTRQFVVIRADDPRFIDAAREAFMRCRYRPGVIEGRPVRVLVYQPYVFGTRR